MLWANPVASAARALGLCFFPGSPLVEAEAAHALRFEVGLGPAGSPFLSIGGIFGVLGDQDADFEESQEKDGEALENLESAGADAAVVVGADGDGEPFGQEAGGVHCQAGDEDERDQADGVGEDRFGERAGGVAGEEGEAAAADRVAEDEDGEADAESQVEGEGELVQRLVDESEGERGREGYEFALEISHFGGTALESYEIWAG